MVYGITRFHTYLFGVKFTLVTDHKPLEMIWKKPLKSAPPRLQRLLVKLQGYDFDVEYHPGKDLIISDALSRLPNPSKCEEIPLNIGVDSIHIHIDLVNFGSAKQDELQREMPSDKALRALWQIVGTEMEKLRRGADDWIREKNNEISVCTQNTQKMMEAVSDRERVTMEIKIQE